VLVVLAPVDQHLVLAELLLLARHDQLRMRRLQMPRQRLRERLRAAVVVHALGVERDVHLDALRPRRLREALEAEPPERVTEDAGHLAALGEATARARVEVERHERRSLHVRDLRQRRVQLEVGQVREPDDRRQVVADAEVDELRAHRHSLAPDPIGSMGRTLLLVEVPALDTVGIALERQRAIAQMRQQDRRDARVVLDDLALGEPRLGVHHLVQVREGELSSGYVDGDA
jgi:hypothetical protein